ncbi:MAG TPA: PA2779 family protein [Gammaproteobacteria bacterium]|nr:PA2779 family protein [Gammaproteobacteria bacterium]
MHRKLVRTALLFVFTIPLLTVQTVAHADVIGAEQFLNTVDRRATLDRVNETLARDEVQRALTHYGVDPSEAAERVAVLNDRELILLAENLEDLPAGGVLATLGLAAIVILILELIGVIDIFKKV